MISPAQPHLAVIEDVITIHDMIIEEYGGRSGIHDYSLLESALNHPSMVLVYGSKEEKEVSFLAATYFFHIIKNHPFADGNKRTGLLTAVQFLDSNGFELRRPLKDLYDDLYTLAIETADSRASKQDVARVFKKLIKKK